jgi:Spy/CpxP family protein refolding chaperone
MGGKSQYQRVLLVVLTSDRRLATAPNRKGEKEMKRKIKVTFFLSLAAAITILVVSPAVSQDKPADNMKILRDKVKADKKLVVAANMDLTESEAKGFWPVYEQYQTDLMAINQRIDRLIKSYAADYQANTLNDDKAQKLTAEFLTIQKAEAELPASYVPKLSQVLPPKKVARYLQIENKIRAAIKYELAVNIPVVQ